MNTNFIDNSSVIARPTGAEHALTRIKHVILSACQPDVTQEAKNLVHRWRLSLRGSTALAARPRQSRAFENDSGVRLLRRSAPRNDEHGRVRTPLTSGQVSANAERDWPTPVFGSSSASWRTQNDGKNSVAQSSGDSMMPAYYPQHINAGTSGDCASYHIKDVIRSPLLKPCPTSCQAGRRGLRGGSQSYV